MKSLLVLLLVFIGATSVAQDYTLYFSPMSLQVNSLEYNLTYQKGKHLFGVSYGIPITSKVNTFGDYDTNFSNLKNDTRILRIGYSHYFINDKYKMLNNTYLGTCLNNYKSTYTGSSNLNKVSENIYTNSISLELGYDIFILKRFYLELYTGVEPSISHSTIESKSISANDAILMKVYIDDMVDGKSEISNNTVTINQKDEFSNCFYYGVRIGIKLNK